MTPRHGCGTAACAKNTLQAATISIYRKPDINLLNYYVTTTTPHVPTGNSQFIFYDNCHEVSCLKIEGGMTCFSPILANNSWARLKGESCGSDYDKNSEF